MANIENINIRYLNSKTEHLVIRLFKCFNDNCFVKIDIFHQIYLQDILELEMYLHLLPLFFIIFFF